MSISMKIDFEIEDIVEYENINCMVCGGDGYYYEDGCITYYENERIGCKECAKKLVKSIEYNILEVIDVVRR